MNTKRHYVSGADDIRTTMRKYYEELLREQAEALRVVSVEHWKADGTIDNLLIVDIRQTPAGVVVIVR